MSTVFNRYNPFWKEFLKYLGWILLFAFLWIKGCSQEESSVVMTKVTVPEVEGKFESKKPTHTAIIPKKTYNKKGETVYIESPINEQLIAENEQMKAEYEQANDSTKQVSFQKAIQLSKFTSPPFEDDNIVININGIVQGVVKEVYPTYKIKERVLNVPVKQKQTVFRLLGGVEVGNNIRFNDFRVKGNLMFQNKKGNIISGSYDTNETVWLGYNVSIFDLKK